MAGKVIYSTVVDGSAVRSYSAFYLALSLIENGGADPASIVIQFLPDAPETIDELFRKLGCQTARIERFGEGSSSTKIGQLPHLLSMESDFVVLLDPDMLVLEPLGPYFETDAIRAKAADYPKPSVATLNSLATTAGLTAVTGRIATDYNLGDTLVGNTNGGLYIIPRALLEELAEHWKRHAQQVLEYEMPMYIDQSSFFLAIHSSGLKLHYLPSNANYSLEFNRPSVHLDPDDSVRALNHRGCLNKVGVVETKGPAPKKVEAAVHKANALIQRHFHNHLFWNFRYEQYPELGSGVGSRGTTADYKRDLMRQNGVETAESVLDFGCGDLEVIRPLKIRKYLGLDQSEAALAKGRTAHPEWEFRQLTELDDPASLPECDVVLCMEVLIHQKSEAAYRRIIEIISSKCRKTLLVSGYEKYEPSHSANYMLAFYEPLSESLRKTGRFSEITVVGCHSDVVSVLRCDRHPRSA